MSDQYCHDDDCPVCGLREFDRNRYFDGKLLVTRDFVDEQAYLTGKHRLHNTLLHGYGTVCGLKVVQHPNPACRHQFVVLQPGLALDCCGNEIVVPAEIVVDIRAYIEALLREAQNFPPVNPQQPNIFLRLVYQECDHEAVPVLLDDCEGCNEDGTEFNRTREGYRLLVSTDEPLPAGGEPLDARLEWQHTLDVDHPRALAFDRDSMRLYLAEWNGETGNLRMYDAANHRLICRVSAAGEPTALARSTLGDLIYVARRASGEGSASIAIFDQPRLETTPDTALRAVLSDEGSGEDDVTIGADDIVRLETSPLDNSLFALTADGRVLRWSAESLRNWVNSDGGGTRPSASLRNLGDAFDPPQAVTPSDMTISTDGRWMVVGDKAVERLIAVNLSAFSATDNPLRAFALPAGDVPTAVEISFDGEYLYALCVNPQLDTQQNLYRIQLRDTLIDFIPTIPDEAELFSVLPLVDPDDTAPLPLAVDVAVSPRDNWVYILRRLFAADSGAPQDRGEVLIAPVEPLDARRGPGEISGEEAADMIVRGSNVEGSALFANLALLGQRLYVAGETPLAPDEEGEPLAGSVSILFVDEASCGTHIRRILDGCATCDTAATGVVLMSLQNYVWNQRIVNPEEGETINVIDNYTHRPLAPSTDTLRKVIECMLAKGISEGIPGPRGPVGPEGPQGDTGATGPRGPGVQSIVATPLAAGLNPTVTTSTIVGDPEGDLAVVLGIPRGGMIREAAVNQGALNIQLVPINPNLIHGDQRMILTIPQPQLPPAPKFNQVVDASWQHGVRMSPDGVVAFLQDPGLTVNFAEPIDPTTVNELSVFVQVRWRDPLVINQEELVLARECECYVGDVGLTLEDENRTLRIQLPDEWQKPAVYRHGQITRLTVTLRGDWLLDMNKRALDGNHIMPGVPGRRSGNGAEGGDWISVIRIVDMG